jgi:hypothetical protein
MGRVMKDSVRFGGDCGRDIDMRVVPQGNNGNTGVDNSDV